MYISFTFKMKHFSHTIQNLKKNTFFTNALANICLFFSVSKLHGLQNVSFFYKLKQNVIIVFILYLIFFILLPKEIFDKL